MMETGGLVPHTRNKLPYCSSDQKYCHLSMESDAVIILFSIDFHFFYETNLQLI